MIVYLCYEDFMEAVPCEGVTFTAHETESLACIWAVDQAHASLEKYRTHVEDDPMFEDVPDVLMHRIVDGVDESYCEVQFYFEDDDPGEQGGFCTYIIERLDLQEGVGAC